MLVNAEQPAPAPVLPPVPLAAMAGGLTMPPPPLLPALALGEGPTATAMTSDLLQSPTISYNLP